MEAASQCRLAFALVASCGESERAKVDDGGSQASGPSPAAEGTAAEKSVKVSSFGRPAVAHAGDVEARAGEGAMARAGDAVAHAGHGATATSRP